MTEYTKQSRNRGAATDSNTGQRSKQGPTHPYSGVTSTPSNYSASRTQNNQSPQDSDYNFEIAHQYIMPLIQTIKDENKLLKHEKFQIQKEMGPLHKLSQLVLTQNQQLRKHYSSRTSDIKKIVETISINASEEANDLNHQSFLIKEGNCLLVKQIEALMKKIHERGTENMGRKQLLDQLSEKMGNLERANRELNVKNKQLFNRCQEVKVESENFDDRENEVIVNQLLSEVTILRNINKRNLVQAKVQQTEYQGQRPTYEDNYNNVVLKILQLGNEAKELQEKHRVSESQLIEKREGYQKALNSNIQALRTKERGRNKCEDDKRSVQEKQRLIFQGKKNLKQKAAILEEIRKQKSALQGMIQAKKQNLKTLEMKDRDIRNQIKKQNDDFTSKTAQINNEIITKINPQTSQIQSNIQDSKNQYATLVQEVDDFRTSTSKLENPLKQIMRLEYELKKRK